MTTENAVISQFMGGQFKKYANSILLDVDSYKVSMWKQYPPNTEYIYSYIESRGGIYDKTVYFGTQAVLQEKLSTPITKEEIDFAEKFWTVHGEPFNRAGWDYILEKHNGYLPLEIKGLEEGCVIPTKNVMLTIVNTDPNVPWLTTWVETSFLRVWYPITVATQSWMIKQLIQEYLELSGDVSGLAFKLHDFGLRGVSSLESGMLGAMAHLTNFMGTDSAVGILGAMQWYGADMASVGYSIPAAEHSTITSWGRGSEALAYANMVKQFSKEGSIYAVVSDSYDIYNAVKMWGTELKDLVVSSKGTLVIRPDSGDPVEVLPKLFAIAEKYFGVTVNEKGYKVLNNVRFIWGDGINQNTVNSILRLLVVMYKYSADNIAFGMGGALLQQVNRDTQKFAMKCSSAYINGEWVDVFKDPITDKGKISKKGRMMLVQEGDSVQTVEYDESKNDMLRTVYKNGVMYNQIDFETVRSNTVNKVF